MKKILTFVIYNKKLLLLLGSPDDPQFHKSFWYVITGGCEPEDATLKDTVVREIKEETGLKVSKIVNLNLIFRYDSLGEDCVEHVFIAYVNSDKIKLNEESIDYKWCSLEEFIDLIYWHYDKIKLKKILLPYVK